MWRRGSVVESRLLSLTAAALIRPPHLEEFAGRLSSSQFTDLDTFVDKAP
jgi:6-phosphogluconate dehydrogenase (decarboxylating)